MLINIATASSLRGLARIRNRDFETITVSKGQQDKYIKDGWVPDRENEQSLRLRRDKRFDIAWEDRVWSLFVKMGFPLLSGKGGASLLLAPKDAASPKAQLDAVAIDHEVAIAVECKAAKAPGKRSDFSEEIGKFSAIREQFSRAANQSYRGDSEKLQAIQVFFLKNAQLSERDLERARQANIIVFDEVDLDYYEKLSQHLGPAAKYQLLADMLPGKSIPGLKIRVPAVRTKMGGAFCYTFPITPEYLLKIAYVSHRSKGKASDINTYQRMLHKQRLVKIREYVKRDGVFPTNIVVNFEAERLRFERIRQDAKQEDSELSGVLGWLEIRPAYKSAWIIDGQHRLFSYSGTEQAASSTLSVLAFDGLAPSKQAALFIEINSKQKSVKQSLLQELYAELHWDADDPRIRVRAILSKCVQTLSVSLGSPFQGRIQLADDSKDSKRCISLTSLFGAIERADLLIAKEKKGQVLEFGPLWAGENAKTLRRTSEVLIYWFSKIRDAVPDWWEKGSGEGGGLAMNDGVTASINVLKSILQHLESSKGRDLKSLSLIELQALLDPYAQAVGRYFASLSEEGRRSFRDLRGVQGQTTRTRRCQKFIRDAIPAFNPPGLDQFLEAEKTQSNQKASEAIDRIELQLQRFILQSLREEFGESENDWWINGVPKSVRKFVTDRQEEDDNRRNGKQFYFTLIDYRSIIVDNWSLFERALAYGKQGDKKKRTDWLAFVNEKRNIVKHVSSAVTLSMEDLTKITDIEEWLTSQLRAADEDIGEALDEESGS